jgi:hypothetical protein
MEEDVDLSRSKSPQQEDANLRQVRAAAPYYQWTITCFHKHTVSERRTGTRTVGGGPFDPPRDETYTYTHTTTEEIRSNSATKKYAIGGFCDTTVLPDHTKDGLETKVEYRKDIEWENEASRQQYNADYNAWVAANSSDRHQRHTATLHIPSMESSARVDRRLDPAQLFANVKLPIPWWSSGFLGSCVWFWCFLPTSVLLDQFQVSQEAKLGVKFKTSRTTVIKKRMWTGNTTPASQALTQAAHVFIVEKETNVMGLTLGGDVFELPPSSWAREGYYQDPVLLNYPLFTGCAIAPQVGRCCDPAAYPRGVATPKIGEN